MMMNDRRWLIPFCPGQGGSIRWRVIRSDFSFQIGTWQSDQLPRQMLKDRHYFFSPALRDPQDAVIGSWVLWADFDGISYGDLDLPITPTLAVATGGGVHCYWALQSICLVQDLASYLRPMVAYGADPACAVPAQLMRVPGSFNCKPSRMAPCEVVHLDLRLTYRVDQFPRDVRPPAPPPLTVRRANYSPGQLLSVTIGDLLGVAPRNMYHCPFHPDDRASLSVSDDRGLWFCHACKIGGDAIEFESRLTGIPKRVLLNEQQPTAVTAGC